MTSNKVVCIDESGNTELGFKDHNQMFLTFASHNYPEDKCIDVISQNFSKFQFSELKYKNLRKKGRKNKCIFILESLYEECPNHDVVVYLVYKPFYMFNSFVTFFHDGAVEYFNPENIEDIEQKKSKVA